ncbi:tRNA (adenosine(37)-N6)-dimethylallyltransferase MiaA [soil metagenome]
MGITAWKRLFYPKCSTSGIPQRKLAATCKFQFCEMTRLIVPDLIATIDAPDLSAALVLTGPTAAGKTALALRIAQESGAEIISMDSMTLYRGMDIGTAKSSQAERAAVPHHLIDVLDPWEDASVSWWLEGALAAARAIQERGKRVLFVGGTGLYLKALLCGLFGGPGANEEIRRRLEGEAAEKGGPEALVARLLTVDPASARRLHPNDLRRIIRALEVWETTGQPLSSWQTQWPAEEKPELRPTVFWIDIARPELHNRINDRVVSMLEAGWLEEAKALRALGRPLSTSASQALGYRELFQHLDGTLTMAEAVMRIQARTRQFAKRQVTWFRHLPGCQPIDRELVWEAWGLKVELER